MCQFYSDSSRFFLQPTVQDVFEMRAQIFTTSYWLGKKLSEFKNFFLIFDKCDNLSKQNVKLILKILSNFEA
jgi:hypothetical protein